MIWYAHGSPGTVIGPDGLRAGLCEALSKLGARRKVLIVPPDSTRIHSRAGELTRYAREHYGRAVSDILPALGTHVPMTPREISEMFGDIPADLFRVHDWRNDTVTLGEVPSPFVRAVSGGAVEEPWPAQVNRLLAHGGHDLILSIGQVVPHEVTGMANHSKNIFVGTGGAEGINKSHFLGAVCGMERIMGRADTPVRRVLNYASKHFAAGLPIVYVLTVTGRGADGSTAVRGLFIGDDAECFERAAALSREVNVTLLDRPLHRVVVYLDPREFKSTWLGNKSIYRTRMAIADGGELIVLAPGVREFGEDRTIDRLIRTYGYCGTPAALAAVRSDPFLAANLSAAAHLIHGSTEGRFQVTYCTAGLSRGEIERAGYAWSDPESMMERYDPGRLSEGFNRLPGGEEIFFVGNPALGLWAVKDRFADDAPPSGS